MDFEGLVGKLRSIVAINVTPFDANGAVDFDALGRNLDYLADAGMSVVTPCGNTGEFCSLSPDECARIIEFSCRRLTPRGVLVLAGIGYDPGTAAEMTKHAAACGAAAVMVHHPPHPFLSEPGYVRYVSDIASVVLTIGVVPYVRGSNVSEMALAELATKVPNVVGVKYAVNDLQRFGGLVMESIVRKPFAWICGTAESWAPTFWAAGATGYTSGLVNVAPKLSLAMLAKLQAGDYASVRSLWAIIRPFEELRARNGSENNVSVVKEAMAQLGLGSRAVRPPLVTLADRDREEVRRILGQWKELGYL